MSYLLKRRVSPAPRRFMSPPSQAQSDLSVPRARLDYVDALRGAACLWVLLHHSLENYPVAPGWSHLPLWLLVKIADIGWLGVNLFLVLSGFCLYYPLVRRFQISEIQLDIKAFAKRRAWRILPPYYMALIIYSGVLAIGAHPHNIPLNEAFAGWKDVPLHIFMLHNLFSSTLGSINGAFWSLALESQLYLIFPLLLILAARRGLKATLAVTFLIAISWQTLAFLRLGATLDWGANTAQWYDALPGRCFEFAIGMSAAALVARPISRLNLRRCALTASALVLPALGCVWKIAMFAPLIDQVWGIIFGSMLVLLHQVPETHFRNNLGLRALTWTGVVSYSLYLIHNLVFKLITLPENSDLKLILWVTLRILVAILAAWVFFQIFERPFIRTRRKTADLIEATVLSPAP